MSVLNQFSLAGRVAAVTGASSGIGQSLACALAAAGADVVAIGRRESALAQTLTLIEKEGQHGAAVSCELSQPEDADKIARQISLPLGSPDILINAAGVNLREPADQVSPESWRQTVDLNLAMPFFLAQALVPAMVTKGWGRVLNIASLQSVRAFANSVPYGASKGGIVQLTRAMAEAWSAEGINCNAITPGFFETPLTKAVFDNPAIAAKNAEQTAIGRNGVLSDLHGAVIFLTSAASDYITGQTLFIDGGFTAK
jgi:NAD(P)-dependent dehydrogenase (short-subunit alcohol dehydrogenase family)